MGELIGNDRRSQLEWYRSINKEIEELRHKLLHFTEEDFVTGNDVIMDYRSGHPVPQSVVGYDYEEYSRLQDLYQKKCRQLYEEGIHVEEFVEDIPDSMTRRIFRMYYIDGMSQGKVAEAICMDRSSVGKKIKAYLMDL